MMFWIVSWTVAYVIGSIPFGVIIGRARGVDIREHGSRNIGATNVGRVLGRPLGVLCFTLDLLKGAGPVAVVGALHGVLGAEPTEIAPADLWCWLGVAAATIAGHLASCFLGFRGGKGVATSFGALVAMANVLTWPTLAALVIWIVVVKVSRYISLASVLAALTLPIATAALLLLRSDADLTTTLRHGAGPLVVTAILGGLVMFRHRSNLARLRAGLEPKIGSGPARGPDPDPEG